MSMASRITSWIVASLLVAPTIGSPAAGSTDPVFEPGECQFQMPPGQVEGETVDCGYLVVPEDRANPHSRTIRLALAVFRPPGGNTNQDPVVYLEGGPGGSPLKLLAIRDFATSYAPVLSEGRELILVDQRGVGRSEPALECPGFVRLYLDLLDQRLEGERLDGDVMRALKVEALSDCAETLGATANLEMYNSAASAADIEDLRLALGYDQLDLWGTSYGTWLALAVMRDYPAGVRSAVLDAPAPPQVDLYADTPDSFARALDEVFTACADDDACDAVYPDLEDVFLETIERLDAEPVSVTLLDPIAGERVPLLMDGSAFLEQVFRGLYSTAMRQALPSAIYDAREGTFDTLLLTSQLDVLRQHFRSWGMYFSVLCHDEVPFSSAEAFEVARARHPELAGMYDHFELGPLVFEACEAWGAGMAESDENEPVRSDIPTLIMTGQYDPIVPPAFGEAIAESLENATLLLFPGLSHGASGTECATDIMLAFLDDPSVTPDARCLFDPAIARFTVPVGPDPVEMEAYTSEELGLVGLRPKGWTEPAPGTFGRMRTGTDSASLALLSLPFDRAEALARLTANFGLTEPPPVTDRIEANDLEWESYRTEAQGVEIDFALAQAGGATLLVVMTYPANERDALHQGVFLPAVGALRHLDEAH